MMTSLSRRAGLEGLGAYILVTVGCGAMMLHTTGALSHVGVALTFGFIVSMLVLAIGSLSGAHLNPAVTLAFALIRHFPAREMLVYVGAQLVGASAGALTLQGLFGTEANLGVTLPTGSAQQALMLEVLLTAVLMLVVASVATDTQVQGYRAALIIGAIVTVNVLWGGPISGASMNPARSFGPSLIADTWRDHWVYWAGPVLGAVLGAGLYQWLRAEIHGAVVR